MINHIVSIKIKQEYTSEQKKSAIDEIVALLKKLPRKIEQIKYYEVGVNRSKNQGGMDIVLISKFSDEKRLNEYRIHHEHIKVLEVIKKHKESTLKC